MMTRFNLIISNPRNQGEYYIIKIKDDKTVWISDGKDDGAGYSMQSFFEAIDKLYKQ
jgi:hypothetical protein